MKQRRLMSRKPAVPGQTREAGEVFLAPTHGRHSEEKGGKRILTPRNARRVRSHSKGRAAMRRNRSPQKEAKGPLEQEKAFMRHGGSDPRSIEPVKNSSPRKSNEWRTVTSELHRSMDKHSSGPAPKTPKFEISPSARSILAKKDQQRLADNKKSSDGSLDLGKSKSTHTATTHVSVNASLRKDKWSSSRTRDLHRLRPRVPESPANDRPGSRVKGSRGTTLDGAIVVPSDGMGGLTIYEVNKQQQTTQSKPLSDSTRIYAFNKQNQKTENKPTIDDCRVPNDPIIYAQHNAKKVPMHHPLESDAAKKRHSSRARRTPKRLQVPQTPVLTPKRGPPTSDRSVSSRVSGAVPLLSPKRPVDQTITLNVETVKIIMADRMAATLAAKKEESNQNKAADGNSDEQKTVTPTTPRSFFSILACTNPTVDPELMKTETRQAQHKLWLAYAKRAIFEAKHGIASDGNATNSNRNDQKLSIRDAISDLSPTMVESTVASTVDEKESEDSGNVEDASSDEDEIRSISSVDLLVRWIGNCGEPDLSDHYPHSTTPQSKLKLHEAARTPRGYSKSRRGKQHDFMV
eukprot:scaffold823_cov219-Amphora_coffeaeformis.AAC.27